MGIVELMALLVDSTGIAIPRPGYDPEDGDAQQLVTRDGKFVDILFSGSVQKTIPAGPSPGTVQFDILFPSALAFIPRCFFAVSSDNAIVSGLGNLIGRVVYPQEAFYTLFKYTSLAGPYFYWVYRVKEDRITCEFVSEAGLKGTVHYAVLNIPWEET